MKHIWLALIILLIGCQSSAKSSFQSLNQAFISWYYKFHPVEATRFGVGKCQDSFRLIGNSENEEFVADISRFVIELSQIDATKLSTADRIDYNILYANLEKMQYVMNYIRPWEWNPLWILNEISEGFFLLSERSDINMDNRVQAVKGRLKSVPEILSRSREMMIAHSPLHIEHGNKRIANIILLIDQLPLKLNSDNLTLDEIDISIETCKRALLNYVMWMKQDAIHMPIFKFPLDLELVDQAFSYLIGERYISEHVYQLADKKLIPTQNRIFSLALPIYLEENDEPVWLDRDDTLEVIHWTIDHIRNEPGYQVPVSDILHNFYKSISTIEKFADSKEIIPKNVRKRIKLSFAPMYSQAEYPVRLFDYHQKKINSEVLYFIQGNEDASGLFPLTTHEIDLANAQHIVPGQSVQIAHAQKYPSQIRYMFPDPVTTSGWQVYAMQMLVNEEFVDWGNEHHILKLKAEIMVICQAIIEGTYYSGQINRKDALSYLRKHAFLNDSEAGSIMLQSDLYYFAGTKAFIGMMEMNSLLAAYKRNQGSNFNILRFHNIVLKDGIIPLYELKKQIFSP